MRVSMWICKNWRCYEQLTISYRFGTFLLVGSAAGSVTNIPSGFRRRSRGSCWWQSWGSSHMIWCICTHSTPFSTSSPSQRESSTLLSLFFYQSVKSRHNGIQTCSLLVLVKCRKGKVFFLWITNINKCCPNLPDSVPPTNAHCGSVWGHVSKFLLSSCFFFLLVCKTQLHINII